MNHNNNNNNENINYAAITLFMEVDDTIIEVVRDGQIIMQEETTNITITTEVPAVPPAQLTTNNDNNDNDDNNDDEDDIDILQVYNTDEPELYFKIKGTQMVQQRARYTIAANNQPRVFDPSGLDKSKWKHKLRLALRNFGVGSFPVFSPEVTDVYTTLGLCLEVDFFLPRRKSDYEIDSTTLKENHHLYPNGKDIDNMLKFVMDAMQPVIYDDDKCIVSVNVNKHFIDSSDEKKGYTTIRVHTKG